MTHFPLRHNRDCVLALHQAYADKTESVFTGLQNIPGNPYQVRLQRFGATRTAIAKGYDWSNRVTLVGDESFDKMEEILAYYAEHHCRCHIEWNPAICYRPHSWNVELEPYLRERGFRQGGFRCVWHKAAEPTAPLLPPGFTLRHFGPDALPEFIDLLMTMENKDPAQRLEIEHNYLFGQGNSQWHHYIGFQEGTVCSTATLFTSGDIGCLE